MRDLVEGDFPMELSYRKFEQVRRVTSASDFRSPTLWEWYEQIHKMMVAEM